MAIAKVYNTGTEQWEPVLVGEQGPTGPTGPQGPSGTVSVSSPLVNGGTSTAAELSIDKSQLAGVSHNYIINGAFDIWQRGGTTVSGGYFADRWTGNPSGATATFSQQSFTLGELPEADAASAQYYARIDSTVADNNTGIFQKIEDARTLAGTSATISFWAKVDSNRGINVYAEQNFGSGGSARQSISGTALSATTSWQRFSFVFDIPSVAGKTIGDGSNLNVVIAVGDTATFTLDIWGVQLEAGSVATPFKRNAPSIQAELAACQRYYQIYGTGANEFITTAFAYSTSQTLSAFNFVQQLRVAPTISFSAATDFTVYAVGAASKSVTAISAAFASPKSFRLQANIGTTDLGAGNATTVFSSSGGGRIEVNAEL